MKLILQAVKSLFNKINIRLAKLEDKISDENISVGKFLPDGTPYFDMKPYFFQAEAIPTDNASMFTVASKMELTEGNTYTVTYNGVEYVSECVYIDNENTGVKGLCLGNTSFFGNPDTGEPFMILASSTPLGGVWGFVISYDYSTSVTFSISGENGKVYKLDEKLLPDSIKSTLYLNATYNGLASNDTLQGFNIHASYVEVLDALSAGRDVIILAYDADAPAKDPIMFRYVGESSGLVFRAAMVGPETFVLRWFTNETRIRKYTNVHDDFGLPTITLTGKAADGEVHTWVVYGEQE